MNSTTIDIKKDPQPFKPNLTLSVTKEKKPRKPRQNKVNKSKSGVLPNDFRTNKQRVEQYQGCCKQKHPECSEYMKKGMLSMFHECCKDCKNKIRKRIPISELKK